MASGSGKRKSTSTTRRRSNTARSSSGRGSNAKRSTRSNGHNRKKVENALLDEIFVLIAIAFSVLLFLSNLGVVGSFGEAISNVMYGIAAFNVGTTLLCSRSSGLVLLPRYISPSL